mgnify:CR=1 FL=1
MKLIDLNIFGGILPRMQPRLIQPFQAETAENCNLDRTDLRPYKGTDTHVSLSKPGDIQSIYRYAGTNDINDGFWFHWTTDVDVVRGPIANDTEETTYYTGDGVPKFTYAAIATSGGTGYPTNSYTLGVPEPDGTPNIGKAGTPDPDTTVEDLIYRTYVVTLVNGRGEEGPPSSAVTAPAIYPGEYIQLGNLPIAPAGNYNITSKRIYRATTGDSNGYQLVTELAIGATNFDDTVSDLALAEVLPSEEWYPPPDDMFSLGIMPNGIMYGLSKNAACFSKKFLPHAWGPLDRQYMPYDGVVAKHFDNTVVVLTEKNPILFTGTDPESMSQEELTINQACVSYKSAVSTPYGVVFASPDGLILIGPQGYRNLTKPYYTRSQWQALKPETFRGVFHDDRYLGFFDDGTNQRCLILDPTNQESGLRYVNIYAKDAVSDPYTDTLFLLSGSNVVKWDAGTNLTYKWKSKRFEVPRKVTLRAGRIRAESYADTTFRLYVDETLRHTQTVTSGEPFAMPRGYEGRLIQVEIEGTDVVNHIECAETMAGLAT